MPRVHPLFPTYEEVRDNPDCYWSDHLPIAFNERVGDVELSFLSYNILGPSAFSGAHKHGGWETPEQVEVRYTRVAKSLALLAQKNDLDFILLQEANMDFLKPALEAQHVTNYYDIYDSERGVVTLVNKVNAKLKVENVHFERQAKTQSGIEMQALQTLTVKLINNELLTLHNVHSMYRPNPIYHEMFYRELLEDANVKGTVIIAGDTNSRFASPFDEPKNIITGIVPMSFNPDNGIDVDTQSTDFPDGGFVRRAQRGIYQLDCRVMDYNTGDAWVADLNLPMAPAFDQYRMVICLDPRIVVRAIGREDKKFMSEIEEEFRFALQSRFRDYVYQYGDITFRLAVKDNNQLGFGICFSHRVPRQCVEVFKTLVARNNARTEDDNQKFTQDEKFVLSYRDKDTFFYASIEMLPNLHYLIRDYLRHMDAIALEAEINQKLDNQISSLEDSKKHKRRFASPENKITCLNRLKVSLENGQRFETVYEILNEWLDDAKPVLEQERYKLAKDGLFYKKVIRHRQQPESFQLWSWLDSLVHPFKADKALYQFYDVDKGEGKFSETLEDGYPVLKMRNDTKLDEVLSGFGFRTYFSQGSQMPYINPTDRTRLHEIMLPLVSAVEKISAHCVELQKSSKALKRDAETKRQALNGLIVELTDQYGFDRTVSAIVKDWYDVPANQKLCETPRSHLSSAKKLSEKTKTAALIRELIHGEVNDDVDQLDDVVPDEQGDSSYGSSVQMQ